MLSCLAIASNVQPLSNFRLDVGSYGAARPRPKLDPTKSSFKLGQDKESQNTYENNASRMLLYGSVCYHQLHKI